MNILMNETPSRSAPVTAAFTVEDLEHLLDRHGYSPDTRRLIADEKLLPLGLLNRLQSNYPHLSGLKEARPFFFSGREQYSGLEGLREVMAILARHNIHIGFQLERELFVEVYRFKATRHILNAINWDRYETDSLFQLVFPQPGMMRPELVAAYRAAPTPEARRRLAHDYVHQTNPHDGHQLLNKPWLETGPDKYEIVEGSQHKYPQCQLVFDRTTQDCFAFCTYCFRHAQVRGDHDMFIQEDIAQIHAYLRAHKEVTDLLITGGDAGYLPYQRFNEYVQPILEDPALYHVRTLRLGSRLLTYQPELILSRQYEPMLQLFERLRDHGVHFSWMAHFSTPRELLNPGTIAAIRRLQNHGVVVRSQSPIMNHISLFTDAEGRVDVERSARNWIDLGHILAALSVRFHSMYCARATGEHHYFTAPLADIDRIFSRVYRSLASLHRPSRYITMTTSAGKLSILGVTEVGGKKAFALKFNESRNMEWMDRVFLAQYDEKECRINLLKPLDTKEFFFEEELRQIETALNAAQTKRFLTSCDDALDDEEGAA